MFQLTYTQKKSLIKLYYYDTSLMKKTLIHLLHVIGSFQNSLLCKFSQTVPREVPKARHEYATITPEGVRYRQQMFHSLNSMMRWFKEHFRDPIPGIVQAVFTQYRPDFLLLFQFMILLLLFFVYCVYLFFMLSM